MTPWTICRGVWYNTRMWREYKKHIFALSLALFVVPFVVFGAMPGKEFAATVGNLLNPDYWLEALRQNITVPTSTDTEITLPTPKEALEKSSPKLREINLDIREETGVDLAKFIGWFAKVLKVFFQIVTDLLDDVSKAMRSDS